MQQLLYPTKTQYARTAFIPEHVFFVTFDFSSIAFLDEFSTPTQRMCSIYLSKDKGNFEVLLCFLV